MPVISVFNPELHFINPKNIIFKIKSATGVADSL